MRGWVQFANNMTAGQVERFFPSGDWMYEMARSSPQNNDVFLDNNQHAAGDRWKFGVYLPYPTEAIYIGDRRYFIAVKPAGVGIQRAKFAKKKRTKKAYKKKDAFAAKQAWKKGYAKKQFFKGPPMSDDDSDSEEFEQSQVFGARPPIDRDDDKGGLELDFEVSDPEEDSQDDAPLLQDRDAGFGPMEALIAEMDEDSESEEVDYDDEEQAREDRWDQYQQRQEREAERVQATWLGWAGVPDWKGGENDLEVDIM